MSDATVKNAKRTRRRVCEIVAVILHLHTPRCWVARSPPTTPFASAPPLLPSGRPRESSRRRQVLAAARPSLPAPASPGGCSRLSDGCSDGGSLHLASSVV